MQVMEHTKWEKKKFKGLELKGKTLGIIGFGNVGARFAEMAFALGINVTVCSESFPSRQKDFPNFASIDLSELLRNLGEFFIMLLLRVKICFAKNNGLVSILLNSSKQVSQTLTV